MVACGNLREECCFFCRFSLARKCSNEGRALMQLDFQQYRTQLEKMSGIRSVSRKCQCCNERH